MTERAHPEGIGKEQELVRFAEGMPIMVWTALPNGAIEYVNQRVLDYFDRRLEQMIAWGWVDVVHPDDLAETGEKWSYSLETGEPYRMEFRLKRASDGAYLWHVSEAVAARDEHGEITRWFGAAYDVHALKTK